MPLVWQGRMIRMLFFFIGIILFVLFEKFEIKEKKRDKGFDLLS